MASLREILERGLSDYLDDKYPDPEPSTTPPKPEQNAPAPTEPAGVEPSLLSRLNNAVMNVSQDQILLATAVALGILGIAYLATRK